MNQVVFVRRAQSNIKHLVFITVPASPSGADIKTELSGRVLLVVTECVCMCAFDATQTGMSAD